MKHSLAKLLSAITVLLMVVLVSVFAVFASTAFERQKEASRVLQATTIKRDMLLLQETLRTEGAFLDAALEAYEPASSDTIANLIRVHGRTEAAFARLKQHLSNQYSSGYAEIMARASAYNTLNPRLLAAARLPLAVRPATSVTRIRHANELLAMMGQKSIALSRDISSSDAFTNQMLRITDIAWRARSDAGVDRHGVMSAILKGGTPSPVVQQHIAELQGKIATSWAVIKDEADLPGFPPALKTVIGRADRRYFKDFYAVRQKVIADLALGKPVTISPQRWTALSNHGVDALMAIPKAAVDLTEAHAAQQLALARSNFYFAIMLMLASIALASFAAVYVMRRVIRPLRAITHTMEAIAGGDLKSEVPFDDRRDEIGQFACALKMFRDSSTERMKLEKALVESRVAQETAENSSRVKSEFLANMSHELRTPLNAIIGFSDIMQHQIRGPLPKDYHEYASLINESGNHLLNLISDVLDLAKIEAGKFSMDLREIDLDETVDYCLRLTGRRAETSGVTLVKTMPPGSLILTADPRACKQILLNLLSNAVKFTRQGGTVEVAAAVTGDRVTFSVRDTGIGIPANVLSRIGGAFEQASNDPMLAREGTGLGLALVKALVAQHGGSLRIESQEHVGTKVSVELPRDQAERVAA